MHIQKEMETLTKEVGQERGRQRDFPWKSRAVSKHSRMMGIRFTHPAATSCGFRLEFSPGGCGLVSQADIHHFRFSREWF